MRPVMFDISFSSLFFWILALVSVASALAVVLSKQILRAAIFLAVVLISTAGLYILLDYEFLAGVQVMVYVGGVVVLIVFAVMLTSSVEVVQASVPIIRRFFALLASVLFFSTTSYVLSTTEFLVDNVTQIPESDVRAIGLGLLDISSRGFILPFEVISLLLLAAVIGAIVVAKRREG